MIRKSRRINDFIPFIIFAVLFITSVVFYFALRGNDENAFANTSRIVALVLFRPLNCIFGTTTVLYAAELLGIVRINRHKIIRIIVLVIIGLFVAELSMYFINIEDDQSLLHVFKNQLFPVFFLLWRHVNDLIGMLIYEIIGIGMFVAIGRKSPLTPSEPVQEEKWL